MIEIKAEARNGQIIDIDSKVNGRTQDAARELEGIIFTVLKKLEPYVKNGAKLTDFWEEMARRVSEKLKEKSE